MASEKRKGSILLTIAVVLLITVCGIYYFTEKEPIINYATSYDELEIFIKQATNTERIKAWQSEEGMYYFFLPAYAGNGAQITIGNLQKGDNIYLDEIAYSSTSDLSTIIEWGKEYDTKLQSSEIEHESATFVFLKSENLSSIYIETESNSLETIHADKEVKEKAALVIRDELGNISYDNKIEYIKTRGNSTFLAYEKKAYQIKLYNAAELLGMDKAKKWILLANYVDNTLLRNQIVYHFANHYVDEVQSIEGVFTDLYINGEYLGNYYLCEKVEVAENRLEITDLDELNQALNSEDSLKEGTQYVSEDGTIRAVQGLTSPENITGGYLVEIIPETKYNVARSAFRTQSGKYFEIVSPENATIEEAEYICNLFNEIEGAIGQEDGINPHTNKHFTEYIDLESWGTKYVIEELFHNPDAPGASYYFYKDADDSFIYAGPMWDYDRALGSWAVAGYSYSVDLPQGVGDYGVYASELMKQEEFSDYVKQQFKELICPYIENQLRADIAIWEKELAASANMNKVRWPGTRGYYESKEASIDYIIQFMETRIEHFKEVWLQDELYHTVTFIDYEGRIANEYVVKHGEYLQQTPTVNTYVAIFNGWKSTKTGKSFDIRLPILEDAVYQSQWIDVSLLLQNGLNSAQIDVNNVDVEALEALLKSIKIQQGVTADE